MEKPKAIGGRLKLKGTKIEKKKKSKSKSSNLSASSHQGQEEEQSVGVLQPEPGSGRIVSSGVILYGFDTKFREELSIGDVIIVFHPKQLQDEERIVVALSHRTLTLSEPFSTDLASTTAYRIRRESILLENKAKSSLNKAGLETDSAESSKHQLQDEVSRQLQKKIEKAKSTVTYREKTGMWGYRVVAEETGKNLSAEDLLDMRVKKMGRDKYCCNMTVRDYATLNSSSTDQKVVMNECLSSETSHQARKNSYEQEGTDAQSDELELSKVRLNKKKLQRRCSSSVGREIDDHIVFQPSIVPDSSIQTATLLRNPLPDELPSQQLQQLYDSDDNFKQWQSVDVADIPQVLFLLEQIARLARRYRGNKSNMVLTIVPSDMKTNLKDTSSPPLTVFHDEVVGRVVTNPTEMTTIVAQATLAQLLDLCQSVGLGLVTVIDQDNMNAMKLEPGNINSIEYQQSIIKTSYSSEHLQLRLILKESFKALTLFIDVLLITVLRFSMIEISVSRVLRRKQRIRPEIHIRLPRRLSTTPKKKRSSLESFRKSGETRYYKATRLHPKSTHLNFPHSVDHRKFSFDVSKRLYLSLSNLCLSKDLLRCYRTPHLITLIEKVIICGSGLGIESDGLWNAGLLLRLGTMQLLNGYPQFALSALSQCQFIAEGEGHTCKSRLFRTALDSSSSSDCAYIGNMPISNDFTAETTDLMLPSSMNFYEDLLQSIDVSFIYFLKIKTYINQLKDFAAASRCCEEWFSKHQVLNEVHGGETLSTTSLFKCRIYQLTGVAHLGHSRYFLTNSERRQSLMLSSLEKFNIALSSDPYSWSLHYHHALCLAYLKRWDDCLLSCQRSTDLFCGYPGTWALLAAAISSIHTIQSIEHGKVTLDRGERLQRTVKIIQLGLTYCRRHPALLLMLIHTVIKLSDDYNPYRYFDFVTLSEASTSIEALPPLLVHHLLQAETPLHNVIAQPLSFSNIFSRQSKTISASAIVDACELFDLLVHQVLHLPSFDIFSGRLGSVSDPVASSSVTNDTYILDVLHSIDSTSDSDLTAALVEMRPGMHDEGRTPTRNSKKKDVKERKPKRRNKTDEVGKKVETGKSEKQSASLPRIGLFDSSLLNEMSFGSGIRSQLELPYYYSDRHCHWQGVPVPNHYDIQLNTLSELIENLSSPLESVSSLESKSSYEKPRKDPSRSIDVIYNNSCRSSINRSSSYPSSNCRRNSSNHSNSSSHTNSSNVSHRSDISERQDTKSTTNTPHVAYSREDSATITIMKGILSQFKIPPSCSLDVIRIHPIMTIMADLLCDIGKLDMAQQVLHRARRLLQLSSDNQMNDSSDWIRYEISLLHLRYCQIVKTYKSASNRSQHLDQLIELYKRLSTINLMRPLSSRLLTLRGAVTIALGDYSVAMSLLEESLILNSLDVLTLRLLSLTQHKLGLHDEMMETLYLLTQLEEQDDLLPLDWLPIEVI